MKLNNISTLFGKYRCEDNDKLLAELNINKTNDEELKYTLSWKNTIDIPNKAHPHFATVSPNIFHKNINENQLVIANVGGSCQFTTIDNDNGKIGAFGSKNGICFYYNENQKPRASLQEALNFYLSSGASDKKYCDSLQAMQDEYKLWSNQDDVWLWKDRI